jgi:hypothetical protein
LVLVALERLQQVQMALLAERQHLLAQLRLLVATAVLEMEHQPFLATMVVQDGASRCLLALVALEQLTLNIGHRR